MLSSLGALSLSALTAISSWLKLTLPAGLAVTQAEPVYIVMEQPEGSENPYVRGVVRDIESAVVIVAKMKKFEQRPAVYRSNCTIFEDEEGRPSLKRYERMNSHTSIVCTSR
jgi:hypothetical protein